MTRFVEKDVETMIQEQCDQDPEFKKIHERSKPLFEMNRAIIDLQIKENLSLRQLAKRLKLTKKRSGYFSN